jgi:hypothetical protein
MAEQRLIGLIGYARSGKNTVAETMVAQGWKAIAFADVLKIYAANYNPELVDLVSRVGWGAAKRDPRVRPYLQHLGDALRAWDPKVFTRTVFDVIDTSLKPSPVVITDVRLIREADAVVDHGGLLVRVTRPGVGPANNHPTEIELDDYPVNAVIVNDSTLADLADKTIYCLVTT